MQQGNTGALLSFPAEGVSIEPDDGEDLTAWERFERAELAAGRVPDPSST